MSVPAASGPAATAVTSTTRRRLLPTLAVATIVAVGLNCAGLLYADLHQAFSGRAFGFAVLFAFVPVLPLATVFCYLNHERAEPYRLLVLALAWGALAATLLSLRLNGWLAGEIGDAAGPRSAIFIAPWVEETTKSAIIFAIVWWRRHEFNSVTAGVVYGGLAGTGFAFTENIVYYGQIFQRVVVTQGNDAIALDAVQELFWWRGVAAPFVHPMFTMMTGLGIGLAVRHRHVGVRICAPVAGFCAAALLHMGYNTVATFAVNDALSAVYISILVPTLLVAVAVVAGVRRHERRVLAARLHDYTAFGWMHAEDIPFIVTRKGRRAARRLARDTSPAESARLRVFQRTAIDLGSLRDRRVRGVTGPAELEHERALITAFRAQRCALVLPHPARAPSYGAPSVTSSW